jgi:hypothetical protein
LVWEVESRARTDVARDGFSPSTVTPKRLPLNFRQRRRCGKWKWGTGSGEPEAGAR